MIISVPVPLCPTCATPFVLRVAFTFGDGKREWLYQRDCKHKITKPYAVDGTAPLTVPDE